MGILNVIMQVALIFVSLLLIGVILLQRNKGAGAGVSFGMGEAVFGADMGNVLTRTTIVLGIIFLANNLFVGMSLPIIFATWVIFEGVAIIVQSSDYKHFGFPYWWVLCLLGLCGAVLGVLGLRNPDVSARTRSTLIGLGIVAMGAAYLFALLGINKFEKALKR